MKRTTLLAALMTLTTLGAPVLRAQAGASAARAPDAGVAPAAEGASLERIARDLAEITTLLRRQVEQGDVSLALRRAEMATALHSDVNRRLDELRSLREGMEEGMSMRETEMRDMLPEMDPNVAITPEEREEMRRHRDRMERFREQEKAQLRRIEVQIGELEAQESAHRVERDRWHEVVDRYFGKPKP